MGYLRILLALAVAVGHLQAGQFYNAPDSTIISVGPVVAVKLFFVISGFYMAMVFGRYPSGSSFFVSRAMRLYPIYWATIALSFFAAYMLNTRELGVFIHLYILDSIDQPLALVFYWLSNLSFVGLDLGIFLCQHIVGGDLIISQANDASCVAPASLLINTSIVQPAWTLSLELYFYLLVPVFALCRIRTLAGLALSSFVLAMLIAILHNKNPWFRSFFPAELYLFLAGFLAFKLQSHIPMLLGRGCAVISLVCAVLYQHISFFDWTDPSGANIALYLIFAVGLPTIFSLGEKLPHERILGDLSYPIYISHALTESILYTTAVHSRFGLSLDLWIALNIAAVVLVAMALLVFSGPIERARHRRTLRMSSRSSVDSRQTAIVVGCIHTHATQVGATIDIKY